MRMLSRSGTCSCLGAPTSGSRAAIAASTSTTAPSAPIAAFRPTSCDERPAEERACDRPDRQARVDQRRRAAARAGGTLPIAHASAADHETAEKTPAAKRRLTSSANEPTNACSGAAIANSSVAAIVTRLGPNLSARRPAGHGRERAPPRCTRRRRCPTAPCSDPASPPSPAAAARPRTRARDRRRRARRRAPSAGCAGRAALLLAQLRCAQGSSQSIGSAPCSASSALARENGREPKNPLCAESGLG